MRTRHRPPSLVSMWMLDVFCCALGCVTLLWLLSNRAAQEEASRNQQSIATLAETERALVAARQEAETVARDARAARDQLQTKLTQVTSDRDRLTQQLTTTEQALAATRTELASTEDDRAALSTKLESAQQSAKLLRTQLADATERATSSAATLEQKQAEVARAEARVEAATKALAQGQRELAAVGQQTRATGDTLRQTADELTKARATIVDLQGQKAKLADRFDQLQADAEARFAGISLTGRRVVFLVDISGSMKLLDDRTPAPDKWGTVIETIARVMRSLPKLEKFQVITFSSRSAVLFPSDTWQEYLGEPSVNLVRERLAQVRPDGDTNMYDALDLAFRQKATGLDTIYVFSDGLPTSGPGLTPQEEQNATAQARSDRLAKHILSTLKTNWNRPSPDRIKVNSVGFFFESPDVGAFLWALARDNDGSFVGMSRP